MKKILLLMLMIGLAAPAYGAGLTRDKAPVLLAQQQSKPKKKGVIRRTIDNLKKNRDQRRQDNKTPKTNVGVRG